jgi:Major Facilitator Superfamily
MAAGEGEPYPQFFSHRLSEQLVCHQNVMMPNGPSIRGEEPALKRPLRWNTHAIITTTALSSTTGRVDHLNRDRRRVLWVACGAHALHDGFTDTLHLPLPMWQAEFALGYAAIGILRALYAGVMAGLQVPVAKLAQRIGGAAMLAIGTAGAAAAYLVLGAGSSVAILAAALIGGGIGSSTQHPIASNLVATAYAGPRSRGALGTYNFVGDLGKMALPSIAAGLIAVMSWRSAVSMVGMIGLAGAIAIGLLLRRMPLASVESHRGFVGREQSRRPRRSTARRIWPAARDRHPRQRDADGLSDLPTISPAGKRSRGSGNWRGTDTAVRRRCCRKARMRLS